MSKQINIGIGIKKFRKEKGYTQTQFCEITGYSQTYLSQIERAKQTPTIQFINDVAKHLKVSVVQLFWSSIEEKNIKPSKRENFKVLKPSINKMFKEIF
ncbi:MAG: helix-turn-helix transcriptional regulator [Flavobacteriaceae bacterium]